MNTTGPSPSAYSRRALALEAWRCVECGEEEDKTAPSSCSCRRNEDEAARTVRRRPPLGSTPRQRRCRAEPLRGGDDLGPQLLTIATLRSAPSDVVGALIRPPVRASRSQAWTVPRTDRIAGAAPEGTWGPPVPPAGQPHERRNEYPANDGGIHNNGKGKPRPEQHHEREQPTSRWRRRRISLLLQ